MWDVYGEKFEPYSKHTLKFFYLERGKFASNCAIDFNLPVEPTGELWIEKQLDDTLVKKQRNEDFDFEIDLQLSQEKALEELTYHIYDSFMDYDENLSTPKLVGEGKLSPVDAVPFDHFTGTVQLKHGQFVVINDLPSGTTYTATEIEREGQLSYTTHVKNGFVIHQQNKTIWEDPIPGKSVSDKVSIKSTNRVRFINSVTYELPNTGGPGRAVFWLAGAALVIGGALGLCYQRVRKGRRSRY